MNSLTSSAAAALDQPVVLALAGGGCSPRIYDSVHTPGIRWQALDWAQGAAWRLNPSDTWDRLLVAGLARDFQQMRLDFLARTGVGKSDSKAGPGAAVADWAEAQATAVRQFRALIARAQASVVVSPAMLAQLASQARNLLAR